MQQCQNCGGWVTDQYVRVFVPEEIDQPRACPSCPDMIRDEHGVREKRA